MQTITTEHDPLVREIHPFTVSGMGPAPFRFVGIATIPSPTLAEANPTAYNNALAALPRDLKNGCGSCAHCWTGIMNIHIVENANGERYGVGCDCIAKTPDKPLVRASHLARLKAERAKRNAAREARRAAWLAEVVNPETGETREQEMQRKTDEARAAAAAAIALEDRRRQVVRDAMANLADLLADGRGGFCDSIALDLKAGYLPRGRALDITLDILAKITGGRRGSKKHQAAWIELEAKFTATAAAVAAIA